MKKTGEKKVQKKGGERPSRLVRFVRKLAFFCVLANGVAMGAALGVFGSLMREMPQISQLDRYRPRLNTRVFAADAAGDTTAGQPSSTEPANLLAEFTRENRVMAKLSDMPPDLPNAFISIEDHNFYKHHGIDFVAVIRALIVDLRAGRIRQGASTITMQLPRNIDIIGLTKARSWKRKIMETIMAFQIERKFTKEEIL
ncbi:MAG: transglycosylase domain-containing protein, partial [Candidatus Hydrogenedentes bacterium]|nr:transglycosylase domain-containing protein [Candidatus Hydrogenedentota bacterium]